jgi:hypothetical protein
VAIVGVLSSVNGSLARLVIVEPVQLQPVSSLTLQRVKEEYMQADVSIGEGAVHDFDDEPTKSYRVLAVRLDAIYSGFCHPFTVILPADFTGRRLALMFAVGFLRV